MTFAGLFAALLEKVAHLTFGFAQPHVENLGTFDAEEELGMIFAGLVFDLQAQVVCSGLAEQGLAATGGTVKQEALRHRVIEALEEMRVQIRKLDRVSNGLNCLLLATDAVPWERFDA